MDRYTITKSQVLAASLERKQTYSIQSYNPQSFGREYEVVRDNAAPGRISNTSDSNLN